MPSQRVLLGALTFQRPSKKDLSLKKYRNILLNGIFLVVVFALTLWSVFRGQDLSSVLSYIEKMNPWYLIPCILCVLCFILGESVIIHYLMGKLGIDVKKSHCCLYSFIGFFYSAITPSASGGQPMQIVAMRKDGIPVAVSTICLVIVTITYKLVLVILGAIVLVARPAVLMAHIGGCLWIIYLGMFLNVVCIGVLLVLVFVPKVVRRMGEWCLKAIDRIHPFKDPGRQFQRLDRITTQYEGAAEFFKNNLRVVFNVLVMTIVQRFFLFFVTGFVYMSFNQSGESFLLITVLQGMVSVSVDMLPLPGGMGVSENLFLYMFDSVFGPRLTLPGMVLSRGISYYAQLAICAVMTIVAAFVIRDKRKAGLDA